MRDLAYIQSEVLPELERVKQRISSALTTTNPILSKVVENFLSTQGKQLRPIMVVLTACLLGSVNDTAITSAAAIELLHSASLIHDDVVDNTPTRRSLPTVNSLFDNRVAVLSGDFFVANSLRLAASTGNIDITDELGELGKQLSVGEFEQMSSVRTHSLDESQYFRMIYAKTASLFVACVRMAGYAVGASKENIDKVTRYATLFGEAFQITDDIFDYFEDSNIGKPTGHDIREGKITLPLIFALNNSDENTREKFLRILENGDFTDNEIEELLSFAKNNGGIRYAYEIVENLRNDAVKELDSFEDCKAKKLLTDLFDFIVDRKF